MSARPDDLIQKSATVWRRGQLGATLVVGALGPPVNVASRVARPPGLVPQPTTLPGRHRRP